MARPRPKASDLAVFETDSQTWLHQANTELGSDRETFEMLVILFRDYHKHRYLTSDFLALTLKDC
jgi:hypothetical protein